MITKVFGELFTPIALILWGIVIILYCAGVL